MNEAAHRHGSTHAGAASPVGRVQALVWLALFAALLALLGGSSRFDAVQNIALRPMAALFLIPALYYATREALAPARMLLVLLGLMAGWTALQLLPLPPAIWQALPGREDFAALDRLNGLEDAWRPIALVPMRAWNAFAALIVPVTAVLLALALRPDKRALLVVLAALGVADAALGLLQIMGAPNNPLYFYTHTNDSAPVGIFANENHSAVFSVLTMLVIARLALSSGRRRLPPLQTILMGCGFVLALLAVLVSGSRAGIGLALGALLVIGAMAWLWLKRPQLDGSGAGRWIGRLASHPRVVLALGAAIVIAVMLALLQYGRAPGAVDVFAQTSFEDLRWRLLPVLGELMSTHWLAGIGFGSFDAIYEAYEPDAFLGPAYLNQAHNDWAQLVIEGGLPAILLLAGLGIWLYGAVRKLYARNPAAIARSLFWCTLVVVIALASLFDYPLRTPTFQMAAGWLLVALVFDGQLETAAMSPRRARD